MGIYNKCRTKKAFSLVEVSIAVFVFSLISGSLLVAFQQRAGQEQSSEYMVTAQYLALEFMENCFSFSLLDGFDGSVDGQIQPASYTNMRTGDPPTINGITYDLTLSLSNVSGFSNTEMTLMQVVVSWAGGKTFSLSSYKANF